MNGEQLLQQLNRVEDRLVMEASRAKRSGIQWSHAVKWVVMFVLLCGMPVFYSLYARGGCGPNLGVLWDGAYYFGEEMLFRFKPDAGSEALFAMDEWCGVNEYGIYYIKGRTLYVRIHETGETAALYQAPFGQKLFRVWTLLRQDGKVELRLGEECLLLDGRTGEMLDLATEELNYREGDLSLQERVFRIGTQLVKVEPVGDGSYSSVLLVDGEAVLPETCTIREAHLCGDHLVLRCDQLENEDVQQIYVLTAEGELIAFTSNRGQYYRTGNGSWIFGAGEGATYFDVETQVEQEFVFISEQEMGNASTRSVDDYVTDGAYVYSLSNFKSEHSCWKIVLDENGRPAQAVLVNDNLLKEYEEGQMEQMKKRLPLIMVGALVFLGLIGFRRELFLSVNRDKFWKETAIPVVEEEEIKKLLTRLPLKYSYAEAVEDGCAADLHLSTYHLDPWQDFLEAVTKGEVASVTIVQWSIEGTPMVAHLGFNGRRYCYVKDHRRSKILDIWLSNPLTLLMRPMFEVTYGSELVLNEQGYYVEGTFVAPKEWDGYGR